LQRLLIRHGSVPAQGLSWCALISITRTSLERLQNPGEIDVLLNANHRDPPVPEHPLLSTAGLELIIVGNLRDFAMIDKVPPRGSRPTTRTTTTASKSPTAAPTAKSSAAAASLRASARRRSAPTTSPRSRLRIPVSRIAVSAKANRQRVRKSERADSFSDGFVRRCRSRTSRTKKLSQNASRCWRRYHSRAQAS